MKTTRSTYARREVVDAARRRRADARAAREQLLQGTAELVDYFITQPERERLERVIEACADQAYGWIAACTEDSNPSECRAAVIAAGRRAAKGKP